MNVPDWVQDAIFYEIFPDRFANGDKRNDPVNVVSWGAEPTEWGFHGGDLKGISDHIDYLVDLGINALYLTPIFQSPSNHRYNAIDYFKIDPKLGTLDDFHTLIETAHRSHIRVVIDGVFNHCGRGFFAFNDILENGIDSPYRDWFHILHFPVDAYSPGDARDYLGWWRLKSLPKFNTKNSEVRRYIYSVARYWLEMGADGWRLDVPNEIDDDLFWEEFRRIVRTANPEAYILGEIWDVQPRWVGPRAFDGLMNYPLRTSLLDFLNGTGPVQPFADDLETLLNAYPEENIRGMYNLLGSHDTERVVTMLNGDIQRLRMAFLFQIALPGAPAIYYGDEIGLTGGKDPDCRKPFPWNLDRWNTTIRDSLKALIEIRKQRISLQRGNFKRLLADDDQRSFAFARNTEGETTIVAFNGSNVAQHLRIALNDLGIEDGVVLKDLLGAGDQRYPVIGGSVEIDLAPSSGMLLG
jgi:glycosidase